MNPKSMHVTPQPSLIARRPRRLFFCAILAGSALFSGAFAQGKVQDPEFDKLLEGLLSHEVPESTVPDVQHDASVLFLDAREREEYQVSHLPDAFWVGYDDFSPDRLRGVDKDRPIVVYCSVGYRSERVAEKLISEGFTRVSNLYGGIFEWVNQGCTLENELGQTRAVHTYNRAWSKWVKAGEKVY